MPAGQGKGKGHNAQETTLYAVFMSSVFSSLHESLQQVLAQRLDWTELREVQEEACRAVRSGGDALILAPTAGGKSEAALIPVMDDLLNTRAGGDCLSLHLSLKGTHQRPGGAVPDILHPGIPHGHEMARGCCPG